MWGLIPAQSSQGADPYRKALHKKAAEPQAPNQPVGGDLSASLLSLDDLLPGGRVDILMVRKSLGVSWGFEVEVGTELNYSLVVNKVKAGSLADEQQLMRGDVITAINGRDVTDMTHSQALDLIHQTGLELTLTLDPQPVPFPTGQVPKPNLKEPSPIQQNHFSQPVQHQYDEQPLQQQQQPIYERTERRSRTRTQAPAHQSTHDDIEPNRRSKSFGPTSRGVADFPAPTWFTEPGWTPKSKPLNIADSGWRSRSRPQAVARTSAYPSLGEMGWSPKPRGANNQQYKSNPSLNEYGWTPSVKEKPTSAFTRVISNGSANVQVYQRQRQRDNKRQPEHQREYQQQQENQRHNSCELLQQPQLQYQLRETDVQQQQDEQPNINILNQQPDTPVQQEPQSYEQPLQATQYNQQQHDASQQHKGCEQEQENNQDDSRQQEQPVQHKIYERQQLEMPQQPLQNQSYEQKEQSYQLDNQGQLQPVQHQHHGQGKQQQQPYKQQTPYTLSDYYLSERNKRRAANDEDFSEGMPAWYGSLRPAGGRHGRWLDSNPRGVGSTRTQDPVEDSGWIPHGLGRETRMIQAQTDHAATLPYHPPTRLNNQLTTGQKLQQRQINQQRQRTGDQLHQKPELNQKQLQQQLQQQDLGDYQEQQVPQQYQQQNDPLYEPHWSEYPKKPPHTSQVQESGNDEKFKSEIQNIHLINTTWTTPQSGSQRTQKVQQVVPSGIQQQQQQQRNLPSQLPEISNAQIARGERIDDLLPKHNQVLESYGFILPQLPKTPQQFYTTGNQQQVATAAVQQAAPALGQYLPTAVPWATSSSKQPRTVSSAFIDFYVQEDYVRASRDVQEDRGVKVQEYQGGFVDFYVIAEGTAKKPAESINAPEIPPHIKVIEETRQPVLVSAASNTTGKTQTGGFVDFYVLPHSASTEGIVGQKTGEQALDQTKVQTTPHEKILTTQVTSTTLQKSFDAQPTKTEQPRPSAEAKIANDAKQPDATKQQPNNQAIVKEANKEQLATTVTNNIIGTEKIDNNKATDKATTGKINPAKPQETNGKVSGEKKVGNGVINKAGVQVGKLKPQEVKQKPEAQKLTTTAAFKTQLKPTKGLPGKLK